MRISPPHNIDRKLKIQSDVTKKTLNRSLLYSDIDSHPYSNEKKLENKRVVGLDILRYLLAFLVFLFHTEHINCDYGILNLFIRMGAVAMTGFFMLSGFSLYLTYRQKDLTKIKIINIFYVKRFIGVFPIYYFTALGYAILLGKESLIENIILAPIAFLGLQSIYSGSFPISHFGGTWFISCITVCYLVYPYLQSLIYQMNIKNKIIFGIICVFIILWSPFFRNVFDLTSYYDNPLIRLMEFIIGVLIASLSFENNQKIVQILKSKVSLTMGCIILFTGVALGYYLLNSRDYMLYDWVVLPSFILIIMSLGNMTLKKLQNNKVITYLSSISYDFFLAQFFVWPICRKIFFYTGLSDNIFKIVLSLVLCFIIAIMMHEIIEKPVGKFLKRKILTTEV